MRGVVLDRMQLRGASASSGLLEYKTSDNGTPAKLIFGATDLAVSVGLRDSKRDDDCFTICMGCNKIAGSMVDYVHCSTT